MELVELKPGEYVPDVLEFGKIYYSAELHGSKHLCLCGCGVDCYLPIKEGEWKLFVKNGKVTIVPSIKQRFECESHYVINNGVANFL